MSDFSYQQTLRFQADLSLFTQKILNEKLNFLGNKVCLCDSGAVAWMCCITKKSEIFCKINRKTHVPESLF